MSARAIDKKWMQAVDEKQVANLIIVALNHVATSLWRMMVIVPREQLKAWEIE